MFTQIQFKKNTPQDGYRETYYVYIMGDGWAESIEKALRFSGYQIEGVRKNEDPWSYHASHSSLWVQRDADGTAVALMDTEETNDLVFWAVESMSAVKLGKRSPVERPMTPKSEEW
jgi:hypothetical protein